MTEQNAELDNGQGAPEAQSDTATGETPRSDAPAEQELDWGSFFDDEPSPAPSGEEPTGDQVSGEEPDAEEPAPENRGAPEEPAAPTEGETPPAEEPSPTAEQPAEPTPEVTPQEPRTPERQEPEPSAEDRDRLRAQAVEMLEREYALDDRMKAEFNDDPASALPKLAAQVHMRLMDDVYGAMYQTFPQLYQRMQGVDSVRQSFTQDFDKTWPGLKQHRQEVQRSIQLIRAQDPNRQLSNEDLINEAGVMTALRLRVPTDQARGQAQTQQSQSSGAPQEPAPKPFTPASPGGGSQVPASRGDNPWAQFVEDI